MAKGAAKEASLGRLHSKLTEVFLRVLSRYESRLNASDNIDFNAIEDDMLKELFDENTMPNPAMMSAVSKFLKDNNVSFDTEQVNELSALEQRLEDQRKRRGNIVSLTSLPKTADG